MRIVQLLPGTANTFYCQNCMRDAGMVRVMRQFGHDVTMVPMYLPLTTDDRDPLKDTPMFFGGINVYLQQKFSLFRRTPRFLDRMLDMRGLLRWAAGRSGMTDARSLGQLTLSMLRGEEGLQSKEYRRLMDWLVMHDRPDVLILANALLLGFVPSIRRRLDASIVCLLEDEDEFLDELPQPYRRQVEQVIGEHAEQVDAFVACSAYYGNVARQRFSVPEAKLHVLHNGVEPEHYSPADPPDPPAIGYLSRMHPDKGLDLLAEAFVRIKKEPAHRHVKLRLNGGATVDDRPYINQVKRTLQRGGVLQDVEFYDDIDRDGRVAFLRSLSVLSVPSKRPEAFGMFILEALASGVPVVQPNHGACPELLGRTGGGRLHAPNDPGDLASHLSAVLADHSTFREQAMAARQAVAEQFHVRRMAEGMMGICEAVAPKRPQAGVVS